jgi:hypothetical protein
VGSATQAAAAHEAGAEQEAAESDTAQVAVLYELPRAGGRGVPVPVGRAIWATGCLLPFEQAVRLCAPVRGSPWARNGETATVVTRSSVCSARTLVLTFEVIPGSVLGAVEVGEATSCWWSRALQPWSPPPGPVCWSCSAEGRRPSEPPSWAPRPRSWRRQTSRSPGLAPASCGLHEASAFST